MDRSMTTEEVHLLCDAIKNIGECVEDGYAFVSVYDIPAFEAAIARMIRYRKDYYDSFRQGASNEKKLLPIDSKYKAFLETLAGPYGKVVFAAYCKKYNISRRITWGSKLK
jgi:hypothetical protein